MSTDAQKSSFLDTVLAAIISVVLSVLLSGARLAQNRVGGVGL